MIRMYFSSNHGNDKLLLTTKYKATERFLKLTGRIKQGNAQRILNIKYNVIHFCAQSLLF